MFGDDLAAKRSTLTMLTRWRTIRDQVSSLIKTFANTGVFAARVGDGEKRY